MHSATSIFLSFSVQEPFKSMSFLVTSFTTATSNFYRDTIRGYKLQWFSPTPFVLESCWLVVINQLYVPSKEKKTQIQYYHKITVALNSTKLNSPPTKEYTGADNIRGVIIVTKLDCLFSLFQIEMCRSCFIAKQTLKFQQDLKEKVISILSVL